MDYSKKTDLENSGIIDLNMPASPAILAGILGVSVPLIYQYRQENKLPPNSDASYRACLNHHIVYFKTRSNAKVGSMTERKILQEIRNGIAKEAAQWLDIKKQRNELLDIKEFAELITPLLSLMHMSFIGIARKYPQAQPDVDSVLNTLQVLGERIAEKASLDGMAYVQKMLDLKVELCEIEESLLKDLEVEDGEDEIG